MTSTVYNFLSSARNLRQKSQVVSHIVIHILGDLTNVRVYLHFFQKTGYPHLEAQLILPAYFPIDAYQLSSRSACSLYDCRQGEQVRYPYTVLSQSGHLPNNYNTSMGFTYHVIDRNRDIISFNSMCVYTLFDILKDCCYIESVQIW